MIIQGLLIVLAVLIIANFGVGVLNRISPPCTDAIEYFQGAARMPDGVSAGLGSIPTHTWRDFVGARRVQTGDPNVIGLTSYNQKNGYIGKFSNETFDNCTNSSLVSIMGDDSSDCSDRLDDESGKEISKEATDAIDDILNPNKKNARDAVRHPLINNQMKAASLEDFEIDTDAVVERNTRTTSLKGRHMSLAHNTARDGYTSRPMDKAN